MKYSKIIGTGSYLPEKTLSNYDFEKFVDTTNEWIVTRTGIHSRHVAGKDETPVSMAEVAAKKALEAAGLNATDIDLIVISTATPEKFFPSTACLLQERLQTKSCIAFDVNAACSGFLYGITIADNFIRSGSIKNALVISSEVMTSLVDWKDRNTCVLFGDGAGAVVLQASDEPGIISSKLHANGRQKDTLYFDTDLFYQNKETTEPRKFQMKGRELFKFAVEAMADVAKEVLEDANMEISAVDWIIPHQANNRIIEALTKRLRFPAEQVINTIAEQANTSSASIPLALDHAIRDNVIKSGQIVLMDAFGAGLAWGGVLIKI